MKSKLKYGIGSWFVICFLLVEISPAFANGDSTKIKNKKDGTEYPLDDPRNPNCPCHKYQQLADEEYQKSQKELNQKHVVSEVEPSKEIIPKENSVVSVSSSSPLGRMGGAHKRNFLEKFFFKLNRKLSGKHKRWRKPKTKIAECFVWI